MMRNLGFSANLYSVLTKSKFGLWTSNISTSSWSADLLLFSDRSWLSLISGRAGSHFRAGLWLLLLGRWANRLAIRLIIRDIIRAVFIIFVLVEFVTILGCLSLLGQFGLDDYLFLSFFWKGLKLGRRSAIDLDFTGSFYLLWRLWVSLLIVSLVALHSLQVGLVEAAKILYQARLLGKCDDYAHDLITFRVDYALLEELLILLVQILEHELGLQEERFRILQHEETAVGEVLLLRELGAVRWNA